MTTEYFTEIDLNKTSFYATAQRIYRVLKGIQGEYEEKETDLSKRATWEDDHTIQILKSHAISQIQILEMVYRESKNI